MAKPQLENGHTKIANELVEALAKRNFSAYESRLLWVIFRNTYGWNKKTDRISYTQFEKTTGIDRRHISRAINSLKARGIITCIGIGYLLEYGIQKNYELWDLTPKEATIIDTNLGNDLTPKEATIIDTNLGNDLTPKEATINDGESLPIQGESLPIQGDLTPKEAMKSLPKEANTKAIKHITKAYYKSIYGEFKNVLLTDEEYHRLLERFGKEVAQQLIETLSEGIASKGYKYDSHYATILAWRRKDDKEQKSGGQHGVNKTDTRQVPKKYTRPEDL